MPKGQRNLISNKKLGALVSKSLGLDRRIVRKVLTAYQYYMCMVLGDGHAVNLYDVGTLELRLRKGRTCPAHWKFRNTPIVQPDMAYVKFKSGAKLRAALRTLPPNRLPKPRKPINKLPFKMRTKNAIWNKADVTSQGPVPADSQIPSNVSSAA